MECSSEISVCLNEVRDKEGCDLSFSTTGRLSWTDVSYSVLRRKVPG